MKKNKFCITFAWAVWSSKTPITNYISTKLNLPIFNNDAIRTEVIEDLWEFNQEEYTKRRNSRLKDILDSNISFIYDASVDREWLKFKEQLMIRNYKWYIVSLDLSKDLLARLYLSKEYHESLKRIDELINDHKIFIENNSQDINLHISNEQFDNRIQIGYENILKWINK